MENTEKSKYRDSLLYRVIKRLFDFLLSFIAFIVFSPFFLIIAIAIKLDSKGPVFFKHKRVGLNGKTIYLYKFRSMVNNAEDLISSFTPEQQKEWKENYKLEHDPRITRVGNFLRKTSLDEIPQLLNILGGSLSIVGPRPVIAEELEHYGKDKDLFLSAKPGLTGYWACSGRSNLAYDDRMKLELYYIEHASIWMDIKIIFKTAISVLKHEGAR